MKVEGSKTIDAEINLVWASLINSEVLKQSIPGCKSLEKIDEDTYKFEIELKVAAIVGKYSGEIKVVDPQPPHQYGLKIEGSGALGHMQAMVRIELQEQGDTGTEMFYDGDAEVGGKVAKVGQRVLSSVAKLVTNQFFSSFAKQIKLHTSS